MPGIQTQPQQRSNEMAKTLDRAVSAGALTPKQAEAFRSLPDEVRDLPGLKRLTEVVETVNRAVSAGAFTPKQAEDFRSLPNAKRDLAGLQRLTEEVEGVNWRLERASSLSALPKETLDKFRSLSGEQRVKEVGKIDLAGLISQASEADRLTRSLMGLSPDRHAEAEKILENPNVEKRLAGVQELAKQANREASLNNADLSSKELLNSLKLPPVPK